MSLNADPDVTDCPLNRLNNHGVSRRHPYIIRSPNIRFWKVVGHVLTAPNPPTLLPTVWNNRSNITRQAENAGSSCYDKVGAQASANLFSLVLTCRANDVDRFEYFSYIFEHLPGRRL